MRTGYYRDVSDPIVLYDGVCGLCNRLVRFILLHDPRATFRFASLQSPLAAQILERHATTAGDLNTACVVVLPGEESESLLSRSDAVLYILGHLGGTWGVFARILRWMPRRARNWIYDRVSRNRYRIFGRYDSCPVPDESMRSRFLDI